MATQSEIEELAKSIRLMGGTVVIGADTVTIAGVSGIGPHPMPFIQAAERMRQAMSSKIGAAILGFRGAVRCCRMAGLDENKVFELVRDQTVD